MPGIIYSGTGTYSPSTLNAVYKVNLPVLAKGTYKFITEKVYNFSSADYPNTILLFMSVNGAKNTDLSNMPAGPLVPVSFNIGVANIINIDPTCIPLNTTTDINVIIHHDDEDDVNYALLNYYDVAPSFASATKNAGDGSLESAVKPKVGKMGILKPKI